MSCTGEIKVSEARQTMAWLYGSTLGQLSWPWDMLLLRPTISSLKPCWMASVRIDGPFVVSGQYYFGHNSLDSLPFHTMSGGFSAKYYPSLLGFTKDTIPSWLSAYISMNLHFLRCGFPMRTHNPDPRVDKEIVRCPSKDRRTSSTSVLKCSPWNLPFCIGLGKQEFIM